MPLKFKDILKLYTFSLPKEFNIGKEYKMYSILVFFLSIIIGNLIRILDQNSFTQHSFFFLITSVGIIIKYLFYNLVYFSLFFCFCKYLSARLNLQDIRLLFLLSLGFNSIVYLLGTVISVFISIISSSSTINIISLGVSIDGTINYSASSVKIISILSLLSSIFVGYSAKYIKPISWKKVISLFLVSTILSNILFSIIGAALRSTMLNLIQLVN